MEFQKTEFEGVIIVEPEVFKDSRGFFYECFQADKYAVAGIPKIFVQDNHSQSQKNTLRGLHAQRKFPQGKLVRVLSGEIFDVVVDIRKGSPTFAKWLGVNLSAENFKQIYVPPGYLHGFCVISETAEVEYKCTEYYHSEDQLGVFWNDPQIKIDWPTSTPILSPKDEKAPLLSAVTDLLPSI